MFSANSTQVSYSGGREVQPLTRGRYKESRCMLWYQLRLMTRTQQPPQVRSKAKKKGRKTLGLQSLPFDLSLGSTMARHWKHAEKERAKGMTCDSPAPSNKRKATSTLAKVAKKPKISASQEQETPLDVSSDPDAIKLSANGINIVPGQKMVDRNISQCGARTFSLGDGDLG